MASLRESRYKKGADKVAGRREWSFAEEEGVSGEFLHGEFGESSRSSDRASRTVLRSHGVFVERVASRVNIQVLAHFSPCK